MPKISNSTDSMTVKKSLFKMKDQIFWFVPAILVTLGIFSLSTFLSFPVQIEGVGYLDKIEHCFAYFVLVLSFLIAYKKAGFLTKQLSLRILVLSSLYGFSLELVQYLFFDYRYFEWIDAGANVLGVLLGFGVFIFIDRVR